MVVVLLRPGPSKAVPEFLAVLAPVFLTAL